MRGNARLLAILVCLLFGSVSLLADGSETLGPPSLTVASGTGAVAAGTGLSPSGTGAISINVPAGVTVQQVLLYWNGEWATSANFDEISINGGSLIAGTLIGQSLTCDGCVSGADVFGSAFRADITSLNLVTPGANNLSLALDDPFDVINSGATVLVIFDDGVSPLASIPIRDGHDWAFNSPPTTQEDVTIPQTYTFAASPDPRTAKLILAFGSAQSPFGGCGSGTGNIRPNVIEVTVGGTTTEYLDPMVNSDGDFYDSLTLDVLIPAGATSVTVQAFSEDRNDPSNGCLVASFAWLLSTLVVPPPPGGEGCTPGYWKNHLDSWAATGYSPSATVASVFSGAGAYGSIGTATLLEALSFPGGPGTSGGARILLRAAVAALLNASHPDVDFDLTAAEIISDVNAALASNNRATMLSLASSLDEENNSGCPLN